MDILLVLGGLGGLFLGGEMLVRGAVALAHRLRIPPLVIGLTLVGFGTSLPELVTSLQAAFAGSPGIAVGNVVGSNIGNILLILGIAVLIRPMAVARSALARDGVVMCLAALVLLVMVLGGSLDRVAGAICLLLLAVYVGGTIWYERRRQTAAGEIYAAEAALLQPHHIATPRAAAYALGGLVLTIVSARYLVFGAIGLAQDLGMSETVIGLTVVAIGTSMPELAASIVAARRNHGEVALGNIIGSNIFNVLGILGATALIRPLEVPTQIAERDIWVMLAATAALMIVAWTGKRIVRAEGGVLVLAYAAYLGLLVAVA